MFVDDDALAALCAELGAEVVEQSSFPFPRPRAAWFTHNEFVTVAVHRATAS